MKSYGQDPQAAMIARMSLTLISPSWFTSSEQNDAQETDSQPSLKKDEPETASHSSGVIMMHAPLTQQAASNAFTQPQSAVSQEPPIHSPFSSSQISTGTS